MTSQEAKCDPVFTDVIGPLPVALALCASPDCTMAFSCVKRHVLIVHLENGN